jgi:hypothetical protein
MDSKWRSLICGSAAFLTLGMNADEGANTVVDLDAYVVTGTRTERIIREAPVKTELIKREGGGGATSRAGGGRRYG